jgi:gas vesicle protein
MNNRKGLVIGIVIACFVLAGVSFVVFAPKKSTQTSDYEKSKALSDEMAAKQREAAKGFQESNENPEDVVRPTTKGPVKIGG